MRFETIQKGGNNIEMNESALCVKYKIGNRGRDCKK